MKFCLSLALLCALTPTAGAQSYHLVDLGPIIPASINMWGQVAGNLNEHAVVWTRNHVRDLGVLPGGTFSEAAAINDLGIVAGTADGPSTLTSSNSSVESVTCTNLVQPFLWSPLKGLSAISSLPPATEQLLKFGPDACNQLTQSSGINLLSQVTATNQQIDSYVDGYLWDPAKGVSFTGCAGFCYQWSANAINDLGVIVGQSGDLPDVSEPFVYEINSGISALLPVLNTIDKCSGANSINDRGEIAGWAEALTNSIIEDSLCPLPGIDTAPIHAMLWVKSTAAPTDLGTLPGDLLSMAVKVNLFGVVVGMSGNTTSDDPVGAPLLYRPQVVGRPFIWDAVRGMRDLNELIHVSSGWTLQSVSDINAAGQIVGTGTIGGEVHGFLLMPSAY